jgi:hypothetical protein
MSPNRYRGDHQENENDFKEKKPDFKAFTSWYSAKLFEVFPKDRLIQMPQGGFWIIRIE